MLNFSKKPLEFIKYYFLNILLKWFAIIWTIPATINYAPEFCDFLGIKKNPLQFLIDLDLPWLGISFFIFLIINIINIYKLWKENDSRDFAPLSSLPKDNFELNLSPKQINFVKIVKDILTKYGIKNSFEDKYNNGYKQLDKDIKLSSSDYNSAFAEIVNENILLDLEKYNRTPPKDLIKELKECFGNLEDFSNNSKNSKNELEGIIHNLEEKIISLKAYIL